VDARGKAAAPPHPTISHTREVSADLQVRSGDALNLMTGWMSAQGTADTRARTIQIDYAGEVCEAPQEQSRSVDSNPIAARHDLERQLLGGS
jgi:hypothetical protein